MYRTAKPLHMGKQFGPPEYPELDDPEKALACQLEEEHETYEEKYGPDRRIRRLAGVCIAIVLAIAIYVAWQS